jgi:hypothetical protein
VQPGLVNITTTLYGGQGEGAGTGMVISSSVSAHQQPRDRERRIDQREIGGDGENIPPVVGYDVADDVALVRSRTSPASTPSIGNPDNINKRRDRGARTRSAVAAPAPPGHGPQLNRQITATDADGTNAER